VRAVPFARDPDVHPQLTDRVLKEVLWFATCRASTQHATEALPCRPDGWDRRRAPRHAYPGRSAGCDPVGAVATALLTRAKAPFYVIPSRTARGRAERFLAVAPVLRRRAAEEQDWANP
jgi:hypothetical protein